MNIIVKTTNYVDSGACSIIDGLLELGHVVYNLSGKLNYAEAYNPNLELEFDLYLMMDTDAAESLYSRAARKNGTAIPKLNIHLHDRWVDYHNAPDSPVKRIPYEGNYSAMFVRDLPIDYPKHILRPILPWDYAIERRYTEACTNYLHQERLNAMVFYGTLATARRKDFIKKVEYSGMPVEYGEYKFNTADTKWSKWIYGRYTHDPSYYQELCKYRFAFVPIGAGASTMRLGEVYAAGCIPVIQRYPKNIIPLYDFKDGINCILWSNGGELVSKLIDYREHERDAEELRLRCYQYGQEKLLSHHLASYILGVVKP